MTTRTTPRLASGSALLLLLLLLMLLTGSMMLVTAEEEKNNDGVEAGMRDEDVAPADEPEVTDELQESTDQVETSTKETAEEIKRNATFDNKTESGFMPSFHLGPIGTFPGPALDQLGQATNMPFNTKSERVQFAGSDRPNSPFNSLRAIKFGSTDDAQRSNQPPRRPLEQKQNFVKFVDDHKTEQNRRPHKEDCAKNKNERHGDPGSETLKIYSEQFEQNPPQRQVAYINDNYDNSQPHYASYETKPSKFQDSQGYQLHYHTIVPTDNSYAPFQSSQVDSYHQQDEKIPQPDTVINVHPVSYHAAYDALSKPKTVVYVTSHETTRTRKLPYHYYQPQQYEHTEEPLVVPEEQPYPVYYDHQQKSISPWKKILHIIGAFLPLGLLFALLSPKVISAGQPLTQNQNDPNIILSKLRVNDLPAEHKNNRLVLDTDACEERSICRLVNAADTASANFLRHLMLHVTERTPESAVRKKELDRIFEAAKLGNCDILTCNFYDGT